MVEMIACISRDVRGWFVDRRGRYTLLLHRDLQTLEANETPPRIIFPSVSQGLLMLSLTRVSMLNSLGRSRPREAFRRLSGRERFRISRVLGAMLAGGTGVEE